jgi:hypothetical protein
MNETTTSDTKMIAAYVVIAYMTGFFFIVLMVGLLYSYTITPARPITPSITITPPSDEYPSIIFSPSRSVRSDVTNIIHVQSALMSSSGVDFLLPEAAHENVRRLTL